MRDQIDKKTKEIKDLNLNLEKNIKLKTQDLEGKSQELERKVFELEKMRTAMLNILEDVNEQKDKIESSDKNTKKLNIRLKRSNQELLGLDKQKDQFTSITAHELKTPLASIKGFVQLLQNDTVMANKEKRKKYMDIIISDTNRLSRLVTDILDISKLDLGTLKVYPTDVKIEDIIDTTKREMIPIVKAKKIKNQYTFDKKVKTIVADKNRVVQVLTNLVNNAVHYTDEKGTISVDAKQDKNMVVFSISDNGMGIPKDKVKNIFERFYQVDSWLTRKIGGSGLGLAICKGLIESMGGNIWVESVEGKGSTFYFTLPTKN